MNNNAAYGFGIENKAAIVISFEIQCGVPNTLYLLNMLIMF